MLGSFSLMILLFDARRPLARARRMLPRLLLYLVLPGLVSFTLICAGPLRTATVGHFWAGVESPMGTIRGLVANAIRHSPPAWESPVFLDAWVTLMEALLMVAPVFILAAAVSLWVRSLRRGGFAHVEPRLASLILLLTILAGALLALALVHELVGLRYPQARAALYLFPLSVLCGVLLIERADARPRLRAAARLAYALAALVAVQFALQLNVAHFALFRYDAGTKRIFSQILGLDPPRPGAQLRLGVDWLFAPSINFYRRMYDTRWIAPVTRDGPRGGEDYFVLLAEGYESFIADRRLEVLYTDPISGAILAARPPLTAELPPAGSPRAGEEGDVGR
jgi:hypothetical protein